MKLKTRNVVAKTLRTPQYRKRIVKSAKVYSRKGKQRVDKNRRTPCNVYI